MTRKEQRLYWQGQVNAHQNSSLSGFQFCLRENLNYAQFLRWKKKLSVPVSESLFKEIGKASKISLFSGSLKIEVDCDIDCTSLSLVIMALCHAGNR